MRNEESREREYQRALAAYEAKDYDEALRTLRRAQAGAAQPTLDELLLKVKIHRCRKRFISTYEALRRIAERYGDSGDARLCEVWRLLGGTATYLANPSLGIKALRRTVPLAGDRAQRPALQSQVLLAMCCVPGLPPEDWHRAFAEYRALLAGARPYPPRRRAHKRLRVGYLSNGFHKHVIIQVALNLLFPLDTAKFEVFCYALGQADELSEALRRLPLTWRDVGGQSFEDIAAMIHGDEIDILVDLDGHMPDSGLPVLAHQPAAVQLSGLGHVSSTGLLNVDGLISDVYCAPSERSPYNTEPLIRLPSTQWCYAPPHGFPPVSPEPPCLRSGHVTFGSFNSYMKLNDETLSLWRRILERAPGSRLLLKYDLFGYSELVGHTRDRLARLGFDLSRVELRPHSPDYLAEYNDMDIALDPFPYIGGVTTCEALYMGTPVLTLMGERHGTRFGYSMLSNLGLGDLAASTPEAYVDLAVALAQSPDVIAALRQNLRGLMARSPLMDGVGYARAVGDMYERVWHEKAGGHFDS